MKAKVKSSNNESLALAELSARFAAWRTTRRSPRSPFPKELWCEAVAQTKNHPPSFVAAKLGVTESNLRRKIEAQAVPAKNEAFVVTQLPSPMSGKCKDIEIVLERSSGDRLTISLSEPAEGRLAELVRAFVEQHP